MKSVKVITDSDLEENGGDFKLQGGPAIKVRGSTTGDDIVGGALTPVYVLTDADIASGKYKLEGGRTIDVVSGITTRPVSDHIAVPVYSTNSDEWPSVPIVWLLRDDFFPTDYSAGNVDGTLAEPGPGTRDLRDLSTGVNVSGGEMNLTSDGSFLQPVESFEESLVREVGRIGIFAITHNQASTGPMGWSDRPNPTSGSHVINGIRSQNGLLLNLYEGTTGAQIFTIVPDAIYYTSVILRASGAMYFHKDISSWSLVWISDTGNTTPLYPFVSAHLANTVISFIRVPDNLWLPTPLASDGFSLSNTDGLGHAEGVAGGIGEGGDNLVWTDNKGTWTGGAPDTLDSGQAIKTIDVSATDILMHLKIIRNGGNASMILRYTDDDNYLRLGTDATSAILIERVAGVNNTLSTTAITYVSNATMAIRIEGQSANIYYNDAFVASISGIDISLTGTRIGLFTNNLGNIFDDLVAYSGSGYTNIDQYID